MLKGTLTRKGSKKSAEQTTTATTTTSTPTASGSSSKDKKRKRGNGKNYAMVAQPNPTPVVQTQIAHAPPVKKPYTGTFPKCATCQYHHLALFPCRQCTTCGRFGHFVVACLSAARMPANPPPANQYPARANQPRFCYACGDPNHLRPQCPLFATAQAAAPAAAGNAPQAARGRVFNLNATEAQANNNW